ncbi:hypothetical protein AV530_013322 [Patagioenas fasciata monilis]|uniref:Uncharacterized protein n=1 Tax=Patagioenas fasciata monilis TaxID=372326 RepID=A0A1V4JNX6_PATFA|nr:hypothetical protein AV530_013322 [Patagioenas fasciata monilis]
MSLAATAEERRICLAVVSVSGTSPPNFAVTAFEFFCTTLHERKGCSLMLQMGEETGQGNQGPGRCARQGYEQGWGMQHSDQDILMTGSAKEGPNCPSPLSVRRVNVQEECLLQMRGLQFP